MNRVTHYRRAFLILCLALTHFAARGIASPSLGAHSVTNYFLGQNALASISSRAMNTQSSGSTIVVCIGRGEISGFTQVPTDNKVNSPYAQLGTAHPYTPLYPDSGTALYAFSSASGGNGHIITTTTIPRDEVTLDIVEVQNGALIEDFKWNEVLQGSPLTSLAVTTTGPATLLAFWWGDGNQYFAHTAIPGDGFTLIDSILPIGSYVQTAVAVRNVTNPGSYSVTWDSGGNEGAQLWLVAVQSITAPGLQTVLSGSNVIFSWPGWATNYHLEATSNLAALNSWTSVTNVPVLVNSQNTVTNSLTLPARYYRLNKF